MREFSGRKFRQMFDDGGKNFAQMRLTNCVFDNCGLSLTKQPGVMSVVSDVRIQDSSALSCEVGPCVLEDVLLKDIEVNPILIFWSAFFRRVAFEGKIGKIKINSTAFNVYDKPQVQTQFDERRAQFYRDVDWALDISRARFVEFECEGVPADLIRIDPACQVVIRKQRLPDLAGLNGEFESAYPDVHFMLRMFLESPHPDKVLVAPLGRPPKQHKPILEGLLALRELGIADPA